jgi:hypothetical protein
MSDNESGEIKNATHNTFPKLTWRFYAVRLAIAFYILILSPLTFIFVKITKPSAVFRLNNNIV